LGLLDGLREKFGKDPKSLTEDEFKLFEKDQEDKKIAAHMRAELERLRSQPVRVASEGIWLTNIAYTIGMTNVYYDTNKRQFIPTQTNNVYWGGADRLTFNLVLPTLQNRLAKLCKNPPRFDVLPEDNSQEAKDAARLSLEVLVYKIEDLKVLQKRIQLYMWVQECGHAYAGIVWDDTLGRCIEEGDETFYEGDVRLDIESPFGMFVDELAGDLDEARYLYRAKVRKLDYYTLHYGEKGSLVKAEDTWLLSLQYQERARNFTVRATGGYNPESTSDSAIEITKYEKPTPKYPKGRMLVAANGVLLVDKELPVGEIPFAKFDDLIVGGKYYPEAVATGLKSLQDHKNELLRRRHEWVRKLLSGKIVAARGSAIMREALNNDTSEIFYYNPVPNAANTGAPYTMQMPTIPSYVYEEDKLTTQMVNEFSGISEISKGVLPFANIPAEGMQLMIENDDARVGIVTEQHEHAWAKVFSLILKYLCKYYVTPRVYKMAGKNGQYMVKEFVGEDLKDSTHVKVIRGSTYPGSKALRNQEILNRYQMGLLGDPMDPMVKQKVNARTEFGDVDDCFENWALNQGQITRGLEKLKKGIQIEVFKWDNNKMWLERLNDFRLSEEYEALPPEVQQTILMNMDIRSNVMANLLTPPEPEAPMPDPSLLENNQQPQPIQ